jgi:hypothetical protein
MGEVQLRPVTYEELSVLCHEVAVSEAPQFHSPEFLVIRYFGSGETANSSALSIDRVGDSVG